MQDDVEQRLVDPDAAVVFDIAEFSETVHEEADSRAGGTDHFGECFLGHLGNQILRLAWLAEIRHQQQRSSQAAFAGVEQLVDEVGLGADAAVEHEVQKEGGQGVLLMQGLKHLRASDSEGDAGGERSGAGGTKRTDSNEALLAEKIASHQQRDGGFFPSFGDDGEFGATGLKVVDGVCWAALREEQLLRLQSNDLAAFPFGGEVCRCIEDLFVCSIHLDGLFLNAVLCAGKLVSRMLTGRDWHSVPEGPIIARSDSVAGSVGIN